MTNGRENILAACVQFDVRRGEVEHNLRAATSGLRKAAAEGARLAVLPEMWPTSFVSEPSDELIAASMAAEQDTVRLSGELDMVIVGGGLLVEDGECFNRAVVAEKGEIVGEYRKIHLFSPIAEQRYHTPGRTPLIVDTSVGRIGVVICYDIRFPELIRYYFYENVEILCVPSQWPEARTDHWRVLMKARAIENEMFTIGCNRTGSEHSLKNDEPLVFPGDSRIVDPMGQVIAAGAGDSEPVLGEISLRKVRTMRRILPVSKDRRPELYRDLWSSTWTDRAPSDS